MFSFLSLFWPVYLWRPLLAFMSLAKAASKCALENAGGQGAFLQGFFPAAHSPHALVPPQGQDFALPLGAILEIPLRPFLQPARIPLDGCTAFCCISRSSQFGILRSLVRARCVPSPTSFWRLFYGTGSTFDPCEEPAGWLQFFQIPAEQHICRGAKGHSYLSFALFADCPESFSRCG